MTAAPAFLAGATGRVVFLGRPVTVGQLTRRCERLARALAPAALSGGDRDERGPDATVALLLPDSPGLVAASCALLGLGLRPQLLDPAAPPERLAEALRAERVGLLLSFDLQRLIDRCLALLAAPAAPPGLRIGLLRASEELPFPRNLLAPLLRGSGFGQRPAHPAFFRPQPPARPAEAAAPANPADRILFTDGAGDLAGLRAETPDPAAPLHRRAGFAALLAALDSGGSHALGGAPAGPPGARLSASSA